MPVDLPRTAAEPPIAPQVQLVRSASALGIPINETFDQWLKRHPDSGRTSDTPSPRQLQTQAGRDANLESALNRPPTLKQGSPVYTPVGSVTNRNTPDQQTNRSESFRQQLSQNDTLSVSLDNTTQFETEKNSGLFGQNGSDAQPPSPPRVSVKLGENGQPVVILRVNQQTNTVDGATQIKLGKDSNVVIGGSANPADRSQDVVHAEVDSGRLGVKVQEDNPGLVPGPRGVAVQAGISLDKTPIVDGSNIVPTNQVGVFAQQTTQPNKPTTQAVGVEAEINSLTIGGSKDPSYLSVQAGPTRTGNATGLGVSAVVDGIYTPKKGDVTVRAEGFANADTSTKAPVSFGAFLGIQFKLPRWLGGDG